MNSENSPPSSGARERAVLLWLVAAIVLAGVVSRFVPWETVTKYYFDEDYYLKNTNFLAKYPLSLLPDYCAAFIRHQEAEKVGIPPPTRLLYPLAGAFLHNATGMSTARSLTMVSATASALMLIVTAFWTVRMFSPGLAAGMTALVAVSLNQLHLSQRIMIDPVIGIFCLVAMWSLWELGNKSENKWIFLVLYVLAMGALVMVKENSFFVYLGITALLLSRKWTGTLPQLPRNMLLITVATGALSFSVLVFACGGFEQFFRMYLLLVSRSLATPYAMIFGDGPWYRYIVDSLLAQPLPTLLAIGALYWAPIQDARIRYLCIFMVVTYAIMSQVKYGMYYRYAIIWDLPIAALAVFQIRRMARWLVPKRAALTQAIALVVICYSQFATFWQIAVISNAYALTTHELITALKLYNPEKFAEK